jgi:hypothetical protein
MAYEGPFLKEVKMVGRQGKLNTLKRVCRFCTSVVVEPSIGCWIVRLASCMKVAGSDPKQVDLTEQL